MLVVILIVTVLAAGLGAALGHAAARANDGDGEQILAAKLDAVLPQLQCAQCGFPGCRPYADAVARGTAAPDLCPPGGADTAAALAAIMNLPAPAMPAPAPLQVAFIRENECVGCALCLPACPVDAIVGAPRAAHAVLQNACVGCELCLPPCPVDCIEMRPPRPIITQPPS